MPRLNNRIAVSQRSLVLPRTMKKPLALSLFSGQGGLDIGFENAGFQIVAAVEINKFACDTLRQNRTIANMTMAEFERWFADHVNQRCFKTWTNQAIKLLKKRLASGVGQKVHFSSTTVIEADIRGLNPIEVADLYGTKPGDLELIIGGPPCQTFSRSGKRQSIEDERGQLFIDFARFVDKLRPRWFVFENVKGMKQTKSFVPYISCQSCSYTGIYCFSDYLESRKTAVSSCPICSSSQVSINESEQRGGAVDIIVNEFERIGYNCQTFVLNAADFGAPQTRERLFIIGSRDHEVFSPPLSHYGAGDSMSLFVHRKPHRTMWETLFEKQNPYHHPEINPHQAVLWVKNVVRPHDEPVTWTLHRVAPTIGSHQAAKLAIAPFGVPEEQLFRQQWHVLGRRQGDTPPVHVEHTYLSDEDLLKLQTFPEYWFVAGTRMERAFQIGNAVPPVLAEAIGRALLGNHLIKMESNFLFSEQETHCLKTLVGI
jgi:DNA (cytosine-5)-methyltransferase 1